MTSGRQQKATNRNKCTSDVALNNARGISGRYGGRVLPGVSGFFKRTGRITARAIQNGGELLYNLYRLSRMGAAELGPCAIRSAW